MANSRRTMYVLQGLVQLAYSVQSVPILEIAIVTYAIIAIVEFLRS